MSSKNAQKSQQNYKSVRIIALIQQKKIAATVSVFLY